MIAPGEFRVLKGDRPKPFAPREGGAEREPPGKGNSAALSGERLGGYAAEGHSRRMPKND
jgi:hypothetical protein